MNVPMEAPAPLPNAVFVVLAMSLAGIAHVLWLSTGATKILAQPLDFGATFRGKRILGDNKTFRGLALMPLAAGASFWFLGSFRETLPSWLEAGLWPFEPAWYAKTGLICGLAFMLAELPNSFVKRQLGITPGSQAKGRITSRVFFVIDRMDSIAGVIVALGLLTPFSLRAAFWIVVIAPLFHAVFSASLYMTGVKKRLL